MSLLPNPKISALARRTEAHVRFIYPNATEDEVKAAVLLKLAPTFGISRLHGATRYPKTFVTRVRRNCLATGLWFVDGRTHYAGDDSLLFDVGCALGRLKRETEYGSVFKWSAV
jgi:hypothetical protein